MIMNKPGGLCLKKNSEVPLSSCCRSSSLSKVHKLWNICFSDSQAGTMKLIRGSVKVNLSMHRVVYRLNKQDLQYILLFFKSNVDAAEQSWVYYNSFFFFFNIISLTNSFSSFLFLGHYGVGRGCQMEPS